MSNLEAASGLPPAVADEGTLGASALTAGDAAALARQLDHARGPLVSVRAVTASVLILVADVLLRLAVVAIPKGEPHRVYFEWVVERRRHLRSGTIATRHDWLVTGLWFAALNLTACVGSHVTGLHLYSPLCHFVLGPLGV